MNLSKSIYFSIYIYTTYRFYFYMNFIKYIVYKMTIDIHKMIIGNPITKNLMKPCGSNSYPNSLRGRLFNRFTGPGNDLLKQIKFNSKAGQIYKV